MLLHQYIFDRFCLLFQFRTCITRYTSLTNTLFQTTTARRADSEDQEEDEGKAQDAQELLDSINEGKENNNGRLEDTYLLKFFRDKLISMPCQNQGFLLDGFPKNIEQAKELFMSK